MAFYGIGGVPALVEWARENPGDFYRLYARLIPADMADAKSVSQDSHGITLNITIAGETRTYGQNVIEHEL
jgi:hypothetical protein